ncbi:hypothetical protein BELL_0774g00030 [Botrytis elliptica]|uniref:Uncharacterized protein n=1 Tax=Botrytis elliptica TaxID=278938 RepID=A0A4Z1J6X3_9HELO|nr:hypothetical protein BELL_0774g00030 [Botrytis elliptica]
MKWSFDSEALVSRNGLVPEFRLWIFVITWFSVLINYEELPRQANVADECVSHPTIDHVDGLNSIASEVLNMGG